MLKPEDASAAIFAYAAQTVEPFDVEDRIAIYSRAATRMMSVVLAGLDRQGKKDILRELTRRATTMALSIEQLHCERELEKLPKIIQPNERVE